MQIGKYRLEGGGMCPEQYDVFDGEKEVGYLRLRHGSFAAYLTGRATDWDAVYRSDAMQGDGCFEDDEREKFLTAAVQAIDAALCPNGPDERHAINHNT
jgi:hypothetical protein